MLRDVKIDRVTFIPENITQWIFFRSLTYNTSATKLPDNHVIGIEYMKMLTKKKKKIPNTKKKLFITYAKPKICLLCKFKI